MSCLHLAAVLGKLRHGCEQRCKLLCASWPPCLGMFLGTFDYCWLERLRPSWETGLLHSELHLSAVGERSHHQRLIQPPLILTCPNCRQLLRQLSLQGLTGWEQRKGCIIPQKAMYSTGTFPAYLLVTSPASSSSSKKIVSHWGILSCNREHHPLFLIFFFSLAMGRFLFQEFQP